MGPASLHEHGWQKALPVIILIEHHKPFCLDYLIIGINFDKEPYPRSIMKLYVTAGCQSSVQTLVAARLTQANVEVVYADIKTVKSKEFQNKTPLGRTPLLETPQGAIWEASAISQFLIATGNETAQLLGESPLERAQVSQWVSYTNEISSQCTQILSALTGQVPYNKEEVAKARNSLKLFLESVEKTLKVSANLAGARATYADVVVAVTLSPLLRFVLEEKYIRNSFPTLAKWYEATASQPGVKAVLGAPRLCPKPMDFPAPKEKAAPKAAAAPKQAAPAKKAEEEKPASEEKAKDPCDSLPPTSTDMNALKFMFVNEKDRKVGLQKLWEMVDLQGWSFWHMHYDKAEGEGRVLYHTTNLVGGFLQRCEHFRKWALGVHGVYAVSYTHLTLPTTSRV